jgi:arabinose-5-phosphate isomerase
LTSNDIITRGKEIFSVELASAEKVKKRLGQSFVDTIHAILNSKGKVVLVGAGKSGLISQKIAATLRSTGIVALFLHPSDAAHGDLGMVTEGDVVFLISKSGETEEVRELIPALRRKKATIIAMVGEEASRIARQADIWLDIGVEREACPIGLAPTSSTTVQMLMGDAINAVLMQLRGFTTEDFAKNHPGGTLGKRLLLDVSDLMHGAEDNPTCGPDKPMIDVIPELTRTALGGITVVDNNQFVLGVITDGDIRRGIERLGHDFTDAVAEQVMTVDPSTVFSDEKAIDALLLMENRPSQIAVLPVVDRENRCVGMLRLHDLIRAGLRPGR